MQRSSLFGVVESLRGSRFHFKKALQSSLCASKITSYICLLYVETDISAVVHLKSPL